MNDCWPSYLEVRKELHQNFCAYTHTQICSYRSLCIDIYGFALFTPGKKARLCNCNGQSWHSSPSWIGSGTLSAFQVSGGRWTVVIKPQRHGEGGFAAWVTAYPPYYFTQASSSREDTLQVLHTEYVTIVSLDCRMAFQACTEHLILTSQKLDFRSQVSERWG